MAQDTLVKELIDSGKMLTDEICRQGFEVTAAFWVKPSEEGIWREWHCQL